MGKFSPEQMGGGGVAGHPSSAIDRSTVDSQSEQMTTLCLRISSGIVF